MGLPPDRLAYTPDEVAEAIGVDSRTVRRLIEARRLRAVNVASAGRPRWLISAEALEEFLGAPKRT
jgi:excisionase family DNA binding protein